MPKKISVITLGCDKNTVDSEHMLGVLASHDYIVEESPEKADVIVVNTCGFITEAKEQSINTLLSVANWKKTRPELKIIACGCMVQKYGAELADEIWEIDGFLGSNNVQLLPEVLSKVELGERVYQVNTQKKLASDISLPRQLSVSSPSSYLKIAEGCNNNCTYCAIPTMRGSYHSRSISVLLEEAKFLVKNGVKEISLVAQDITQYGIDLYNKVSLLSLLEELVKIKDLKWIRLLYCYPSLIDDNLIQFINNHDKICKYLDIPLQHGDHHILKKMGRHQKPEKIINLIEKIRKAIPDIAIRSTFIVGFPGESQKQFANLLDFLTKIKLDWVGAFKYSQEEGTPAASFSNQISEETKEDRLHALMALQQEITSMQNKRWLGRKLPVLVEQKLDNNTTSLWQGRIEQQAAEVDGVVYFKSGQDLKPGDFVMTKITKVDNYDLIGEV